MAVDLSPGEMVVARGKLAIVQQAFSANNIRVVLSGTGESLMVSLIDIERINGSAGGLQEQKVPSVMDCTSEELSLATDRFDAIRLWRSGDTTISQAMNRLRVSKSYFYRLVKSFSEELGPLSLVIRRRGRKTGINRLVEPIEDIIINAIRKVYKTRAASYSKVWVEVDVACEELGLASPCKDTVARRVRAVLSEKNRDKIKLGADAAAQKYSARPGKKQIARPLEWVQMDHTLVDIILLADDRVNVIGRPWLTIVIDIKTRVILGYYLSLHVPSAVSVACALSQSVLPKVDFVKSVGLEVKDYPFYGKPEVLHMDNAAEFSSAKFKAGCNIFGISPEYRPIGKKHYGGHVERLIGTFMTTKVHFLPGTTMSNAVARKNLDSEHRSTMTFSDFFRWFAREVVIYHSTVHSELKTTPRQAWLDYFAPNGGTPYPPKISDQQQLKLFFMPEETRDIGPDGISLHGQKYWDPLLAPFVGTKDAILKFDPFKSDEVWVKLNGQFCPVRLSDLTLEVPNYEEYRAGKINRQPIRAGAIKDASGRKAYREKQLIEQESEALTKKERRRLAAEKIYNETYSPAVSNVVDSTNAPVKPDYSKPPKRFSSEE